MIILVESLTVTLKTGVYCSSEANIVTQHTRDVDPGLTLVLLDPHIYGFKHILSQIICH